MCVLSTRTDSFLSNDLRFVDDARWTSDFKSVKNTIYGLAHATRLFSSPCFE